MPDLRMDWQKRKYKEIDTVLTGKAPELLQKFYGTYKVIGRNRKVNKNIYELKFYPSEKGNPVLRFYDKDGNEFEFWNTPEECDVGQSPSGDFTSLSCGRLGDRKGYDHFSIFNGVKWVNDFTKQFHPKEIPIDEKIYHYYSYGGFGTPILEMSLQKVE